MNNPTIPSNAVILEPGEPQPLYCARQALPKIFPGIAAQTWANWAAQGIGPDYFRVGKLCIYSVPTAIKFLTRHPVKTNEGNL